MNPCHNNIQEKTEEEAIEEKKKSSSSSSMSSSIMSARPPTTSPAYLVFHHGRNGRSQTFFSLSDETRSVKNIPEMRGTSCWASCQGWLVMVKIEDDSTDCFLLNPVTMEKVELPTLQKHHEDPKIKHDYYSFCVLTSSPHSPNCVVMFVESFQLFCKFCRPGQEQWTKQDLKWGCNSFSWLNAATSCKDNIYITYGGKGIAILDTTSDKSNDGLFTIRRVTTNNLLGYPTHPSCALYVSYYLVESCEEVFMVTKHYKGNTKDVFGFIVFKLDFSTMDWEHTTNLGEDRVFLLGYTCSSSISASAMGVNENCIYFFEPEDRNLYEFKMDEESIYNSLPCPNVVRQWIRPYWMLPVV